MRWTYEFSEKIQTYFGNPHIWNTLSVGFSICGASNCTPSYHPYEGGRLYPVLFAFINKNKKEYWQLVLSLGIGMTLFIIISLIFPNGQELRPSLSGDGIFIEMVRYLYKIDTPTNVFPSIHVFNTIACCIAVFRHRGFHFRRLVPTATGILGTLIVLSTIFLKQHTLLDVAGAIVLNVFCYQLLYKPKAVQEKQPARIRV